ncbi:MAG: EFR1 family ferrodoxin [Lachnospiraceae bacterium]|nr:EFR1 family ferrodoxin [Lachnospiraceae bacterium]
MVLYYSATGNTEYIAKQLAQYIDDEVTDLLPRIKEKDYSTIYSDRSFVICAPVHVCEMPRFVTDYLKKVCLSGNKNLYFVFTSGGYAGIAAAIGRNIAGKKGMIYRGRAEFVMPRNYPISRRYPLLSEKENRERICKSRERIPEIACLIKNGERLRARRITYAEKLITYPFTPIWSKFKHNAKLFHTTDKCIGCGKCSKVCPLNNITLENNKPKWGDSCAHCMACLSCCPTEAVEYGNITWNQYRYRLEKFTP